MGDVVNLNQFRKRRERADKEAKASQNRSRFGRSKGERSLQEAEKNASKRELDGKRVDQPPEEDGK